MGAIVALTAIIVFVNEGISLEEKVSGKRGDLEITDIAVNCYHVERTCQLDIKVLNKGEVSVIITKVILEAVDIKFDAVIGSLESSGEYEVDISKIRRDGDSAAVEISQEVKANSADRFMVSLTAKQVVDEFRSWKFHVTLETSDGPIDGGILPRKTDSPEEFIILPYNPNIDSVAPWLLQNK